MKSKKTTDVRDYYIVVAVSLPVRCWKYANHYRTIHEARTELRRTEARCAARLGRDKYDVVKVARPDSFFAGR